VAKFKNREEYNQWKAQKIEEAKGKADKFNEIKEMHPHKSSSEINALLKKNAPQKSFIELLPSVFIYPFIGNGKYILTAGVIFYWLADFVSSMIFIFGALISVFVGGYLCAYIMKIINSSANGDDEAPDWPDFRNMQDILVPIFEVVGTGILCFAPAIIYGFLYHSLSDPVLWVLVGLGILYYPMSLIAVSLFNSVNGLNPAIVITSIMRVPFEYLIACLMFVLVVVVSAYVQGLFDIPVPFIGSFIGEFFALYFIMVQMRILGIMYYSNQKRLNWFGEAYK
jgi:hypothetical protein